MTLIDALIAALDEMNAESAAEMSPILDYQRCVSAHAVMAEAAEQVHNLPRRNEAGMFPRITVTEHSDAHIVINAMTEYGAKLKREFLTATARYALGSDEIPWSEIQRMAKQYVEGARLAAALDVAHETGYLI